MVQSVNLLSTLRIDMKTEVEIRTLTTDYYPPLGRTKRVEGGPNS
jgi:hypothetical protein